MSGSLYGGNPYRQAVANRYGNALLYDPFRFSFGRDYYSPISGPAQGDVGGTTEIPGVTDIPEPEPFEPVDGLPTNPVPEPTPTPTPEPTPQAAAPVDPYSLWTSAFGGQYGDNRISNEDLARAARGMGFEDLPTDAGADYDWSALGEAAGMPGSGAINNSSFYGAPYLRSGQGAQGALSRLWFTINNPKSTDGPNQSGDGPGDDGGGDMGAAGLGGASDAAYRKGGYTGAGRDGRVQRNKPAGTVHEHEVVLRSEAVDKYGKNALLALNEGRIPASKVRRWAR